MHSPDETRGRGLEGVPCYCYRLNATFFSPTFVPNNKRYHTDFDVIQNTRVTVLAVVACLAQYMNLKMEVERSSETLANFRHITLFHIPGDSIFHSHDVRI
jgi:hypothetical protein